MSLIKPALVSIWPKDTSFDTYNIIAFWSIKLNNISNGRKIRNFSNLLLIWILKSSTCNLNVSLVHYFSWIKHSDVIKKKKKTRCKKQTRLLTLFWPQESALLVVRGMWWQPQERLASPLGWPHVFSWLAEVALIIP